MNVALFLIDQSEGLFLRIYGFLHTFQDANLERGIHRCGFRIKADGCHFNLKCPHVSRLQIFHFRQLMQQTLCIGGELKGGFRLDFKIPKHVFILGDIPLPSASISLRQLCKASSSITISREERSMASSSVSNVPLFSSAWTSKFASARFTRF